jgi:4-methyl-5(b-hydroxyethyl)-thiazole monophosphate biosynthesis
VHLADGFEELEAVTIITVLRRANIEVVTVSITDRKIVAGARGVSITADISITEANYADCDMIILPGGGQGTVNLGKSAALDQQIKAFAKSGKWIAAICAAPAVLGQAGLLKGHKATVYPGGEEALEGAEVVTEDVVISGHIVTSRGPGTALKFAFALVEILKGQATVDKVKGQMLIR